MDIFLTLEVIMVQLVSIFKPCEAGTANLGVEAEIYQGKTTTRNAPKKEVEVVNGQDRLGG